MVPFEIVMAVSHRLSIVLHLTIQPQFVIECLRGSNQRGGVTLGKNLERKGRAVNYFYCAICAIILCIIILPGLEQNVRFPNHLRWIFWPIQRRESLHSG